ncbi:CopG family ribbon-helix-helix protein [Nitrosococcus halophilus]|uniref:CopG family ribbon-helix-helix protein n=1 Tax=Nitrosococcus halophilus TaxID=133539 RepID=UPI00193E8437|nr:CopG family ribbon-helix-helix protein [Nitrosococcus halophilus]
MFTVRIDPEKQKQLDAIAQQLDRSRNYVVNQAIEEFLDTHAWQVEHIRAGLDAAEQGAFATDEEMEAIFNRYRPEEGTPER